MNVRCVKKKNLLVTINMQEKTFKMIYDVHCRFENFFKKEILVKKCMSEMHAKVKLREFVKKKHGPEFDYIIIITCKEDSALGDLDNILNGIGDKNYFTDLLKTLKNKDYKF